MDYLFMYSESVLQIQNGDWRAYKIQNGHVKRTRH